MNRWLRKLLGSLVFLFVIYFNLPVFAQSVDDVKVNISEEAAIPGHILEPGDYVLHRVNSDQPDVYSITRLQDHPEFIGYVQVAHNVRKEEIRKLISRRRMPLAFD